MASKYAGHGISHVMIDAVPDITDQIRIILLRNIGATAIVDASSRTTSEAHWRNALVPSMIHIRVGSAGPASVRADVLAQIRTALADFQLDRDHLEWILSASSLSPEERLYAASAICDLRLEPLQDAPPRGTRVPAGTWFTVVGPDVLIDLLLQPLSVLSDFLKIVFDTWQTLTEQETETYWNNSLPDPALSAVEEFVLRSWGIPLGRPVFLSSEVSETYEDAAKELGFEEIEDVTDLPWGKNPDPLVNLRAWPSPGPRVRAGLVDPFYGHVYSRDLLAVSGPVYLPFRPKEGNYGHLSVSFRTVPRYFADSYADLTRILDLITEDARTLGAGEGSVLYRGQTKEHTLSRPDGALMKLYGRPNAIEPSLLPSGSRRTTSNSTRLAFNSIVEVATESGLPSPLEGNGHELWSTMRGDNLKSAFAQHYGLATLSLDLTQNPMVAAWFATTHLGPGVGSEYVASPIADDDICVIYVFRPGISVGAPIEVSLSPEARPALQEGWVTPNTWGWRSNLAATRLAGAVYFPGQVRKELENTLPRTDELFGPTHLDKLTFVTSLLSDRMADSNISRELMRDMYQVVS